MKTILLLLIATASFAADPALLDIQSAWREEDMARSKERAALLMAYVKRLDLTVPEMKPGKDLRKSEEEHNLNVTMYESLTRNIRNDNKETTNYMGIVNQLERILPLQRKLKGPVPNVGAAKAVPEAEEAKAVKEVKTRGKIVAKLADGTVIEQ